ncbi:hypothetical protein PM082_018913 [Marasmius tenuissimus]|nr:hypothetical protein PM082_018913 [Marasmius tenuissimus]
MPLSSATANWLKELRCAYTSTSSTSTIQPAKTPMRPSFLLLGSTTLVWIEATKAYTATFHYADPPLPPITPTTTYTIPAEPFESQTFSQAGVKSDSDGSETTYIQRIYRSKDFSSDSKTLTPLSETQSRTVTIVASEGGYWWSQVVPVEFLTNSPEGAEMVYQTCSYNSDSGGGDYACVQVKGVGESFTTTSYTNTARDVVVTNVGGTGEGNGAANAGRNGLQLLYLLLAILGGLVIAL